MSSTFYNYDSYLNNIKYEQESCKTNYYDLCNKSYYWRCNKSIIMGTYFHNIIKLFIFIHCINSKIKINYLINTCLSLESHIY